MYKHELTEFHSSCEVGGADFLRFFQSTSLFWLIGLHTAKQAAVQLLSSRGIKNQLLLQGLTASSCLRRPEVLPEVEAGCQFINYHEWVMTTVRTVVLVDTALKYFLALFEDLYNPKWEAEMQLRNMDCKNQEEHSKLAATCCLAMILPLTFCKALSGSVGHPLPSSSILCKRKLPFVALCRMARRARQDLNRKRLLTAIQRFTFYRTHTYACIFYHNEPGAAMTCVITLQA